MATLYRLERRQTIHRPLGEVFDFFSNAENLEALTPAFLNFRILTPLPIRMSAGTRIDYRLSLFGARVRWRTLISEWRLGKYFVDEQQSGPFASWRHVHEFEATRDGVEMTDTVDYSLPLGALGKMARSVFVRRTLDRIFDHRRNVVARVLSTGSTISIQPSAASPEKAERRVVNVRPPP